MDFTLSVVIPNYNNSKFLPTCLESIVHQTYDDLLEVIVVDDCSTDHSREVITAYAEKYPVIRPIFLEKNGKVSAARNTGLCAAKGEYITFVDADDSYYNKDKLKNEMELIKQYHAEGKDIVAYSSIVWMSNDGQEITLPTIKESKYLIGDIYEKMIVDLKASLIMRDYCLRTDILKEFGGYEPTHTLFEDYEVVLKIAKHHEFYYTGEHGTAYRNSVNGLSKKSPKYSRAVKNEIAVAQIKTEPFGRRTKLRIKRGVIQGLKKIYFFLKEDLFPKRKI